MRRRRSSTNRRSQRFVVRVARRGVIGRRRWALQASTSSLKQATAFAQLAVVGDDTRGELAGDLAAGEGFEEIPIAV